MGALPSPAPALPASPAKAAARDAQRDRAALPGPPDHVPERRRAIEEKILEIVVVDGLDGGHRSPVPGHHHHVALRSLERQREIVARLKPQDVPLAAGIGGDRWQQGAR
jgi:hypothetical protein